MKTNYSWEKTKIRKDKQKLEGKLQHVHFKILVKKVCARLNFKRISLKTQAGILTREDM